MNFEESSTWEDALAKWSAQAAATMVKKIPKLKMFRTDAEIFAGLEGSGRVRAELLGESGRIATASIIYIVIDGVPTAEIDLEVLGTRLPTKVFPAFRREPLRQFVYRISCEVRDGWARGGAAEPPIWERR